MRIHKFQNVTEALVNRTCHKGFGVCKSEKFIITRVYIILHYSSFTFYVLSPYHIIYRFFQAAMPWIISFSFDILHNIGISAKNVAKTHLYAEPSGIIRVKKSFYFLRVTFVVADLLNWNYRVGFFREPSFQPLKRLQILHTWSLVKYNLDPKTWSYYVAACNKVKNNLRPIEIGEFVAMMSSKIPPDRLTYSRYSRGNLSSATSVFVFCE